MKRLRQEKAFKSATVRALEVLRILLRYPDKYTKKDLAEDFGVSVDSISYYFESMRLAGFQVSDSGYPDYTYAIRSMDPVVEENLKTAIKKPVS